MKKNIFNWYILEKMSKTICFESHFKAYLLDQGLDLLNIILL